MEEGLPKSFDVVVIGTGLAESIVSAAASRNGHSVLHLDPREYYGSTCATLNFDLWLSKEFIGIPSAVSHSPSQSLSWRNIYRNFEQVWYDDDKDVKEEFDKNKRRFNIDIFPQVILAREELVELLIKSDVSRYLEFLRVGKLFTSLPPPNDADIVSIPLSRADIFSSKSVGLVEKRCLVKFIEAVMQQGQEESIKEQSSELIPVPFQTLEEMAKIFKLSPKVKHLIKSAVETIEDGFPCDGCGTTFDADFVPRCKKYLQSIGRFGNQTPYLWPLYGVGEICQAFCRLSAVYGSIFILKRFISSIEITEDKQLKVTSGGAEFTAKHVVIGQELMSTLNPAESIGDENKIKTVGRGVIITRGRNLKVESSNEGAKGDGICVYKIGGLQVIELNHLSQAVPKNYKLLQVTTSAIQKYESNSPKEYIESLLLPFLDFEVTCKEKDEKSKELNEPDPDSAVPEKPDMDTMKPVAVYGSYFWLDLFDENYNDDSNIYCCAVNSTDLTCQVSRAEKIFNSMFPGEEFLPRPPNSDQEETDDIIGEDILLEILEPTISPQPEPKVEEPNQTNQPELTNQ